MRVLLGSYLNITSLRVSIEFFMFMRHLLFMRHFFKFPTIARPIFALAKHQTIVYKRDQHYIYTVCINSESYYSQMLRLWKHVQNWRS